MKILSIGNSFSQDAHRYLHAVARANGDDFSTVNLYIGDCSLERHCLNVQSDRALYSYEVNGQSSGINVSIKQVLSSDLFDIVTFQEVSRMSVLGYEHARECLTELMNYVRRFQKSAKFYLHETWAYPEKGGLLENLGYLRSREMLDDVISTYSEAFDMNRSEIHGIIPTGIAVDMAINSGIPMSDMYRDSFHLSEGVGRYIAALTWYFVLSGKQPTEIDFCAFDEKVSEEYKETANAAARYAVAKVKEQTI